MKLTKETAQKIIIPLLQRTPMSDAESCGAQVALNWIGERLDLAEKLESESKPQEPVKE